MFGSWDRGNFVLGYMEYELLDRCVCGIVMLGVRNVGLEFRRGVVNCSKESEGEC